MINQITGNLFSVKEGYIIHGCNAQGVMGAGVGRTMKFTYPGAYNIYKNYINKARELGVSPLGSNTYYAMNKLVIINAVTQEYYGNDGKQYTDYDAVRACFYDINAEILRSQEIFDNIPRVLNFPMIGCGFGGGNWEVIEAIIEKEINNSFEMVLWTL